MLYRFNVFGRIIAVERVGGAWTSHLVGNDGKRRPAGLAIPSDVTHAELPQYLYDSKLTCSRDSPWMNRFMGTSLRTGAPILILEERDWKSFHTASATSGHPATRRTNRSIADLGDASADC